MNGFDYVMQQRPLGPDEHLELWMFFISGLSMKDRAAVSQLKFVFHDSTEENIRCVSPYSIKSDKGIVIGTNTSDLKAMPFEPVPSNLREEPAH